MSGDMETCLQQSRCNYEWQPFHRRSLFWISANSLVVQCALFQGHVVWEIQFNEKREGTRHWGDDMLIWLWAKECASEKIGRISSSWMWVHCPHFPTPGTPSPRRTQRSCSRWRRPPGSRPSQKPPEKKLRVPRHWSHGNRDILQEFLGQTTLTDKTNKQLPARRTDLRIRLVAIPSPVFSTPIIPMLNILSIPIWSYTSAFCRLIIIY